MTEPNREAVEAAAQALDGSIPWKMGENVTTTEVWAAAKLALTAALPFLTPQPSQSDEERARGIAYAIRDRWDNSDPCGRPFEDAVAWIAAVRAEAAPQPTQSDEERASRICATGCGCSEDDAETCFFMVGHCRRQEGVALTALAAVRAEATLAGVAAEREACAKVVDEYRAGLGESWTVLECAAELIRARKP